MQIRHMLIRHKQGSKTYKYPCISSFCLSAFLEVEPTTSPETLILKKVTCTETSSYFLTMPPPKPMDVKHRHQHKKGKSMVQHRLSSSADINTIVSSVGVGVEQEVSVLRHGRLPVGSTHQSTLLGGASEVGPTGCRLEVREESACRVALPDSEAGLSRCGLESDRNHFTSMGTSNKTPQTTPIPLMSLKFPSPPGITPKNHKRHKGDIDHQNNNYFSSRQRTHSNNSCNLGVTRYCFGEYKCQECNRTWESSKAWRDFGQQCEKCRCTVKATDLQPLFHYMCKPCYQRSRGKEGYWKNKLCQEGRKCRSCHEIVKPFLTHKLFVEARKLYELESGEESHIDQEINHKQELCEKCTIMGRCCFGGPMPNQNAGNYDAPQRTSSMKQQKSKTQASPPLSQRRTSTSGTFTTSQRVSLNVSTYIGGEVTPGLTYRNVAAADIPTTSLPSTSKIRGQEDSFWTPRNTSSITSQGNKYTDSSNSQGLSVRSRSYENETDFGIVETQGRNTIANTGSRSIALHEQRRSSDDRNTSIPNPNGVLVKMMGLLLLLYFLGLILVEDYRRKNGIEN